MRGESAREYAARRVGLSLSAPKSSPKVPAGQGTQLRTGGLPDRPSKVPLLHFTHCAAPAPEDVPGSHSSQLA